MASTVHFVPLSFAEWDYIRLNGKESLRRLCNGALFQDLTGNEKLAAYGYLQGLLGEPPELFDIVGNKGFWRIPRRDNTITETCAYVIMLGERFLPVGRCDVGEHRDDIIMEGQLDSFEMDDIRHGRLPDTLAIYGRLAPAFSGRPPAIGPADGAARDRGTHGRPRHGRRTHGGMTRHPPGARVPHGELNHLGQVEFDDIEFPDDPPSRWDESSDDSLGLRSDDDDFGPPPPRPRRGGRTPPTPPGLGGYGGRRFPPPRQRRPPPRTQGPPPPGRQGRMAPPPPNPRAGHYTMGISSASSSSDDISDSDSSPKKKKGKGKAPAKAKKPQKSKAARPRHREEVSYSADEKPRSRRPAPPAKSHARRRGRSDDEDDGGVAPGPSRRPAGGRRARGRSPEEEEEDEGVPLVDAAEQAKLEALKAQNGWYGKKGVDEKKG
ncbi:MAG: hypothetical protein Q9174_005899, partial [Haloplaca sp. 1 TL-2023]